MNCPFSYVRLVDIFEKMTLKPIFVKISHQIGAVSYIPKAKGIPMVPSVAGDEFPFSDISDNSCLLYSYIFSLIDELETV